MSQVLECINNSIKKYMLTDDVNCTRFIVFDKFSGIFINTPKFSNTSNHLIIPVCLRQEYYSHMVFFYTDNNTLYYYDPANNDCDLRLFEYLKKKINAYNFIQVKEKGDTNKIFDCTKECLNYIIITLIKWNKNRK